MVRVSVKNTFISCDADEENEGLSRMPRSKSVERVIHTTKEAAQQMSKLEKILDNDQEAKRNAISPISTSPKTTTCDVDSAGPGFIEIGSLGLYAGKAMCGWKDATTPQELTQLRDKLQQQLEEGTEDKEIRPCASNSSVSTMTSFKTNRSRACSNGSISSFVEEFNQEPVQFDIKIVEEPQRPSSWHTWDGEHEMKWKPKRHHDYKHNQSGYGNYAYNKWENRSYDSSSGESMMGSPFTTPQPSPKMMNGQYCYMHKDKMRNLPRDSRHNRVPRTVNLQEEYQAKEKEVTTLMIRNIPNRYTQRELIEELKDLGFEGTFDFLYSPLDKGTMSNVGYAFVNFKSHEYASKCIEAFHNYRFKRHRKTSGKVAAVSAAHLQGLEANLAHYEKTAVNTAKMKQRRPVVLANISSLTA